MRSFNLRRGSSKSKLSGTEGQIKGIMGVKSKSENMGFALIKKASAKNKHIDLQEHNCDEHSLEGTFEIDFDLEASTDVWCTDSSIECVLGAF